MKQLLDLYQDILDNGETKDDRTGVGSIQVFGRQLRFDLSKNFPMVTTRTVNFKSVLAELLWLISGSTDTRILNEQGVHIWDDWAVDQEAIDEVKDKMTKHLKSIQVTGSEPTELNWEPMTQMIQDRLGSIGPIYGPNWRKWQTPSHTSIDQLANVIEEIKTNSGSRRLVVSAWNPAVLPSDKMAPKKNAAIGLGALAPCHALFQFHVRTDKEGVKRLDCQLYQRSADVVLGSTFNIPSYSLLTMMIAKICGLEPGEFVYTIGNAHIYLNHVEGVKEQLTRKPLCEPTVRINTTEQNKDNIDGFKFEDFTLYGYTALPPIKYTRAV